MTWQPIDTAPEDGSHVLVTDGATQRVAWFDICGWTWYQKYGGISMVMLHPTHWMPLPELPAARARQMREGA